jgi:hypothetical protein
METTKRNYKVDLGDHTRFFQSVEDATPFLNAYFAKHNIVLSIVKVEKPKRTPKQAAFDFFYANAGYSYDPKTETKHKGRARCARELAKAERDAAALGYWFEWISDHPFNSHGSDRSEWPETCEICICRDENGKSLTSLSCIDDATRESRRVIEAELASEALAEVSK